MAHAAAPSYLFTPAPFLAAAFFLMEHGHRAPEPARLAFVAHLLAFADLDAYPRRQELLLAFAPGGTALARNEEAAALARAQCLEMSDFEHCAAQATRKPDEWSESVVAQFLNEAYAASMALAH